MTTTAARTGQPRSWLPSLRKLFTPGRRRPRDPSLHEWQLVQSIEQLRPRFENIADEELLQEVAWLKERIAIERGEIGDEFLRTAFALVNEALHRVRGLRFYSVQLLAGILLARGKIAEMQTGEGKTLTAALPAFLLALRGEGVHVATVNAYLAERDFEELRPVFEKLGLSVGLVHEEAKPDEKRAAYRCDVTYGTGYVFGFDYLRDQLVLRDRLNERGRHRFRSVLRGEMPQQTMQRGLAIALVDEADSVLIDDAVTPLILAGGSDQPASDAAVHQAARRLALRLISDQHFRIDSTDDRITLTESGLDLVHSDDEAVPTTALLRPWRDYVELALRAEHVLLRDVHYVIADEEVQLVDQTTGRIHPERQWSGGLQQAVQAAEDVPIRAENETTARITRQRFYQLYHGVCGMTGTAEAGARELRAMYELSIVRVPTNRPCRRRVLPEKAFATPGQKWEAIAAEISEMHSLGRPVLIGTRTISDSEQLSHVLESRSIPHQVLNGKQDAEEATIVAAAGNAGAVTIATNMAGRGTDIRLSEAAREAGGLHVIAAEHHDSVRIDRQLVGRAARQGDPGTARFFACPEDQLIRQYDPDLGARMTRAADASGLITRDCSADIRRLQQRVEQHHFQRRRELYEQDRIRNEILRLGRQSL